VRRLLVSAAFSCALLATSGAGSASQAGRVYVSSTGSDGSLCTRARPCRTFNRAYHVARPGQVVSVAPGTYPHQTIRFDPSKTSSKHVVIQPAAGRPVVIRGLDLGTFTGDGPRHLTIKNIHSAPYDGVTATGFQAGEGTQDVTWVNLDASNFYLRGVKNFHIVGGDWGPCYVPTKVPDACGNNKIDYAAPPYANDRIIVDGARFHNMQCRNHDCSGTGVHFECVFLAGGTNIVIRDSTFRDCEFYDIFVSRTNRTPAGSFSGLRLERNWLDTPWDGRRHQNRDGALAFKPNGLYEAPFANVLVRRNSVVSGISVNDDGTTAVYTKFRLVRNIASGPEGCYRSATYASNVWTGGGCSPSDRRPPFGYAVADGRLKPAKGAAAAVRSAFRQAAGGRSPQAIARTLRRERAPAPQGGWTAAAVRTLVADRGYLGNAYGARRAHPALVSHAVWKRARRQFER
jgi:recombinase